MIRTVVAILCVSLIVVGCDIRMTKEERRIQSEVQKFLAEYNRLLDSLIHDSFQPDFYANNENKFKCTFIYSENETLLYLERSAETSVRITESNINPILRYHEIAHGIRFTGTPRPLFGFNEGVQGSFMNMSFGRCGGLPIQVERNAFVLLSSISITLENRRGNLVTTLPGVTFLIGAKRIDNDTIRHHFKWAAETLFSAELYEMYKNSNSFRKALAHPQLKKVALKIQERFAAAKNAAKEYPLWEFERDESEMRMIAKAYNIEEYYADEILKDKQYEPVAGKLLFYYSSEKAFMLQWCLINLVLLSFVIVILLLFNFEPVIFRRAVFGVAIAINGWVFLYKKPDVIGIIYCLLPVLIALAAVSLAAFDLIIKSMKPKN